MAKKRDIEGRKKRKTRINKLGDENESAEREIEKKKKKKE